jgi:hypothetical protein
MALAVLELAEVERDGISAYLMRIRGGVARCVVGC